MSHDPIEYRAAKVSLVTGLSTLLSIALQLISVPICLTYWGKETYGHWLVLYAAFTLVRALDSGFVSYVGNKLNYLFHQDQTALREHLASSLRGFAVIAVVQLAVGTSAVFFNEIALLLHISANRIADFRSGVPLLILIGTWALSGSYLGLVHRLLIPAGLMYQAAWWSMAFQICQFAGIILAAMLGFDMLATSLLFAAIQFAIYTASALYIRVKLPAYYPWWRHGKSRTAIQDLARSLMLTVSNLIQEGSSNGIVVLISALTGPAAVPVFTTVRTLANLWTNVSNVLTTPLLPDVVRYHAKGEGDKLAITSEAHWVLVGSAINLGVLLTHPVIQSLYQYWTSNTLPLNRPLLCLLLSSVVLTNVGGLITLYQNGVNRLGMLLTVSVTRAFFALVVGGFLYIDLGFAGLSLGILGGELIALLMRGYWFVNYELRPYGVRLRIRSVASITVSSVSVLLYLVSDGFRSTAAPYLFPAALISSASAAVWGWQGLERTVRMRLVRMFGGRLSEPRPA